MHKQMKNVSYLLCIAILALLSYGRIYSFHDVTWDDNCWLMSAYASNNLEKFLSTGFYELGRVPMGIFFYYLFSLHKSFGSPYIIWHSLNIACQIISPVVLYLFLRNYLKGQRLLSFFIASSFAVFPLDYTLPYLSALAYRAATLLTIISFYLTERAFAKDKNKVLLILAILSSAVSYYIFMELTFVFEVARFFVIRYMLIRNGFKKRELLYKLLKSWLPFAISCIPLIIYKFTFRPYGIYEGVYKPDYLFFMKIHEHVKILRMFLFQEWRVLLKFIKDASIFSYIAGAIAFAIAIIFLKFVDIKRTKEYIGDIYEKPVLKEIFIIGILFLIFPIFILEFTGRRIETGFSSSHLNQVQIGYAMIIGLTIFYVYMWSVNNPAKVTFLAKKMLIQLIIALAFGAGVFFNNLNLDLYFHGWEKQFQFWEKFTYRFPSLPEGATFMMDLRESYFDATDLDIGYDLELTLNLLYATSENPDDFRKYKVMAMNEFKPEMAAKSKCAGGKIEKLKRMTHFGLEELDPCSFIVVLYRDGEILVNREIGKKYSDLPYKLWLEKDFPNLPLKAGKYIFRKKPHLFKPV